MPMSERVVTTHKLGPVLLIRLQDEASRNAFTDSLLTQLREAFFSVSEETRCVVLTGVGNYFSTGGTQDSLMAIHERQTTFIGDDGSAAVYTLPLECPVPVIAAMQGHAIGGGLSLGLFADLIVLSKESVYSASFMKYGFTPGFGSTLIFPEKLGTALGTEMLLTGETYRGSTLADRGVGFEVLPRAEVETRALAMAESLAEKPRASLVTLKRHLTHTIRQRLPEITERELQMHEVTFHEPEVKARILNLFHN